MAARRVKLAGASEAIELRSNLAFLNRAGEIRTRDLLNPIQALYQAEPRPVTEPRPSRSRMGDSRTKF